MTPDIREIAAEVLRLSAAEAEYEQRYDHGEHLTADDHYNWYIAEYERDDYTRTAAPSLAEALLEALEQQELLITALRKLGPAIVFNHNIGNWPYWYCELCGARHALVSKVEHTPECAWNIVTAATAREERS